MSLASNNYKGRVLKALFDRLNTEVSELRFIAEDIGQLEETELRPAVAFPCALVDFPSIVYSSDSNSTQKGDVTISIRLGFNTYSNASHNRTEFSLDHSLKRFEIEEKVVDALHNYEIEDLFSALQRISSTPERRGDGLRILNLSFTTSYTDEGQEVSNTHPVQLVIKH